jgi:hypothetical protein
VPPALAMRLGHDGTKELHEMLDAEQQTWSQQVLTVVTERFERRLLDECSKLRVEMARDRFELVKWMFLFWLGQVAAIAAMLNFMLRK